MNATTSPPSSMWGNGPSPPTFPTPSTGSSDQLPIPRTAPPLLTTGRHIRPPLRPFFIREIYKNGFLKRLPHNEKKSSALSKLMRSDRYWVVFSVHDETLPFLELWNEPSEVATKPPVMMFPLIICQHISPSLVPADTEWTFVINFEQSAVRFSCNSRQTMEEWVECIRNKLGEMGIFNARGNLYSKIGNPFLNHSPSMTNMQPIVTSRNPMSPLPEPPLTGPNETPCSSSPPIILNNTAGSRTSIVDASDTSNQTFTTSIYLNQSPPSTPPLASLQSSLPLNATPTNAAQSSSSSSTPSGNSGGARPKVTPISGASSVYLNKTNPTRHVTVIPINNAAEDSGEASREESSASPTRSEQQSRRRSRRNSQAPPIISEPNFSSASSNANTNESNHRLSRRLSDCNSQRRRRTQRSSSLGPLLDDQHIASAIAGLGTRTNSLESVDSNPRQALAKSDRRAHYHRRPLPRIPGSESSPPVPLFGSPPRPSFHLPGSAIPPHVPIPGLTCHPSYLIPNPAAAPPPPQTPVATSPPQSLPTNVNNNPLPPHLHPELIQSSRSPKEQQVTRLRQEIGHPAGVRLTLRKRDCINSIALVDFFGCLWVAGWKKQTDFPILYKAFHLGDQIVSMGSGGVPVRSASEFHKIVKQKTAEMHIEIIVRRVPFGQTFFIKRETEGQPLGIVANSTNSDIKEIIPGSPASVHGMTPKIRSFDGQTFVPWSITEINGRPLNILNKDGEAAERLASTGREMSIVIQPSDIINKLRKQLKSVRNYKDYLLI